MYIITDDPEDRRLRLGRGQYRRKHGVALADIEAAFMAGPEVAPDIKHSGAEQRFIAIGKDKVGRPLFVAFTFRDHKGATSIRHISARYMHQKEIRAHETRSKT